MNLQKTALLLIMSLIFSMPALASVATMSVLLDECNTDDTGLRSNCFLPSQNVVVPNLDFSDLNLNKEIILRWEVQGDCPRTLQWSLSIEGAKKITFSPNQSLAELNIVAQESPEPISISLDDESPSETFSVVFPKNCSMRLSVEKQNYVLESLKTKSKQLNMILDEQLKTYEASMMLLNLNQRLKLVEQGNLTDIWDEIYALEAEKANNPDDKSLDFKLRVRRASVEIKKLDIDAIDSEHQIYQKFLQEGVTRMTQTREAITRMLTVLAAGPEALEQQPSEDSK